MNQYNEAIKVLNERFGCDVPISIATANNNQPHVRTVDGYYEDGSFYVITYALSNKMTQIEANPAVAVCGEWFTAHGLGQNIGHVRDSCNTPIMEKLREAFSSWYNNGHVNENDPNTCILRIRLTDGVLFSDGTKYEIDFVNHTA